MFLVNTSIHEEILSSLERPDFCQFNPLFLRKNHAFLTELHFDVFPDRGNLGPWKSERPYCGFLVSTGLEKINKNTIRTYKVDYLLIMRVQANMLQIQGVIRVLSFLSSSKTLTPSNLHQNGCSKLHWKRKN